jgi:hypothetical protein
MGKEKIWAGNRDKDSRSDDIFEYQGVLVLVFTMGGRGLPSFSAI